MIDLKELKASALGHWPSIAARVIGIDDDFLTTRHGPCPKCGGNDRWRVFDDFDETGAAVCNQCGKFGDGVALAQWFLGCSFPDALKRIGEFLGVADKPKSTHPGSRKRERQDPAKHLEFLEWNPSLVKLWCLRKKPITPEALIAVGAKLARYRTRYTVIAVPAMRDGNPVAWTLYEINGGKLPRFEKGSKEPVEWLKLKVTTGSEAGWMEASR